MRTWAMALRIDRLGRRPFAMSSILKRVESRNTNQGENGHSIGDSPTWHGLRFEASGCVHRKSSGSWIESTLHMETKHEETCQSTNHLVSPSQTMPQPCNCICVCVCKFRIGPVVTQNIKSTSLSRIVIFRIFHFFQIVKSFRVGIFFFRIVLFTLFFFRFFCIHERVLHG